MPGIKPVKLPIITPATIYNKISIICKTISTTSIKKQAPNNRNMFGGKDMTKMMKQMGMNMDEIDAEKVEVHLSDDQKMVFKKPSLSKIEAQGQEIFQLQGNYTKETSIPDEDIELVMEKADTSRQEAKKALEEEGDVAEAVLSLQ